MWSIQLLLLGSISASAIAKQLACNADEIPIPEYFGTKVISLTAEERHEWSDFPMMDLSQLSYEKKNIDFCNVTITYTHPGQGDSVNVYVWLPLEGWNGNFYGQGGGGMIDVYLSTENVANENVQAGPQASRVRTIVNSVNRIMQVNVLQVASRRPSPKGMPQLTQIPDIPFKETYSQQ
jgi:hypothetical protein